jgi:hypothetical protein
MSTKCMVCDVAWALGKSEQQFYDEYTLEERSQLYATYVSRLDRQSVMAAHPVPPPKG